MFILLERMLRFCGIMHGVMITLLLVAALDHGICGQTVDNVNAGTCPVRSSWTVKPREGEAERTFNYTTEKRLEYRDCITCNEQSTDYASSIDQRAQKPIFHGYTFYGGMFENQNATCVNVSFSVIRDGADKTKGFHLYMISWFDSTYSSVCYRINFTTEIDFRAVYDKTATSNDLNKVFYFNCICGVKPNEKYEFYMRPLPFHVSACDIEDDQRVYQRIFVPACGHPNRTWPDAFCPVPDLNANADMAEWNGNPVEVKQLFPNANTVQVSFSILPPTSEISRYEVYLHDVHNTDGYELKEINVTSSEINRETGVHIIHEEINGTTLYRASVEFDWPDLHQDVFAIIVTRNVQGEEQRSRSPHFKLKDNPCDPDPCDSPKTCRVMTPEPKEEGTSVDFGHTCACPNDVECEPTLDSSTKAITTFLDYATDGDEDGGSWQLVAGISVGLVVVVALMLLALGFRRFRRRFWQFCTPDKAEGFTPVCENPDNGGAEPLDGREILFAFPEKDKDFVSIVEKLALYMRKHLYVHPVLPSQRTVDIGRMGQEVWLTDQLGRSSKVLWICSDSAAEWWHDSQSHSAYGNMFKTLIRLTRDERERMGDERGKHAVCFFSKVSSLNEVPRIFSDLPRFELMDHMEKMCFYILEEEQSTAGYASRMPYISGERASTERDALQGALNKWEERHMCPSSRLLPNGNALSSVDMGGVEVGAVSFSDVDKSTDLANVVILSALDMDDDLGEDTGQNGSPSDRDFIRYETEFGVRVDCVDPVRTEKTTDSPSFDTGYTSMLSDPV